MTSSEAIREEKEEYTDDGIKEGKERTKKYSKRNIESNRIDSSTYHEIKEKADEPLIEDVIENIFEKRTNLDVLETLIDEKLIKRYLNTEENTLNRPIKEQVLQLLIEIKNQECDKSVRIDVQIIEDDNKTNKTAKDVIKSFSLKSKDNKYIWVNNKEDEIESFNCVFKDNANDELFLQLELLNNSGIYRMHKVLRNFLYQNNLYPFNFSSKSDVLLNIWRYSKRYNLLKGDIITSNKNLGDVIGMESVNLNIIPKKISKFLRPIKLKIKLNETGKLIYEFPILVDDLTDFPILYPEKINDYKNEIFILKNKLLMLEKEKILLSDFLNNEDFLYEILTK